MAGAGEAARLLFVELPCGGLEATRGFYAGAFGLAFTDFGPSYSCTMDGGAAGADLGLQADPAERTAGPLPVLAVADLDAALAAVAGAGGTVTHPIFAFPGGRRFHFRDPAGNELAAMQVDRG